MREWPLLANDGQEGAWQVKKTTRKEEVATDGRVSRIFLKAQCQGILRRFLIPRTTNGGDVGGEKVENSFIFVVLHFYGRDDVDDGQCLPAALHSAGQS